MNTFLTVTAVIIIACVFLNKISGKIGIPMLLGFIVLGMAFGQDGILHIAFNDFQLAEKVCSIALVFIMFYGGFGTNWKEAKSVSVVAIVLASLGTIFTALLLGAAIHYIMGIDFFESMLLGAVVSSTDAASVFSILRYKKLGLKLNTASLLELESGSNDPFSYMLTVVLLTFMKGSGSSTMVVSMIVIQVVVAIITGVLIAIIAIKLFDKIDLTGNGFDSAYFIAFAILSYAVPQLFGGNGYLSVYITGIILGNSDLKNKQELVHFFDGTTSLMQMAIFFLLGLLAIPSNLPSVASKSTGIFLLLTFIVRPIIVGILMAPFRPKLNQVAIVAWSGLRGAASIVFAIMAIVSGIPFKEDIYHIIFLLVLMSILLQGSLIPWLSKKLDMIDKDVDVLKTFNDYVTRTDFKFTEFEVPPTHTWVGKQIKDLELPPDSLLLVILRNGIQIVPSGDIKIIENDKIVMCAPAYSGNVKIELTERRIHSGNKWIGKSIAEYSKDPSELIVAIARDQHVFLPNGSTKIVEHDILLLYKQEKKAEALYEAG